MKATWGIAAALLLVAASAMDTSAHGWRGKQGFYEYGKKSWHQGWLIEWLDLSEDQLAQIQALKESIREQGQALGEQYRTGFDAILTAEQRETLAATKNSLGLSEEQKERLEALGKGVFRTGFATILIAEQHAALTVLKTHRGKHGKRKSWLIERLDLSEDQLAQIQALNENLREQRQALGEQYWSGFDAILTAEQRETLAATKGYRCSREKAETTETGAAGKPTTAVEETSWGRVKGSFSR